MKILVTGGAGFIGAAFIRHVLGKTDDSVINFDKLTYAGNLESLRDFEDVKRYQFVQGDICSETDVSLVIKKFQPNKIINLAAETHVDKSIDNPYPFLKNNFYGTFNLLKIAHLYFQTLPKTKKSSFKFHHVSSDEVFGDLNSNESPFTEQSPYSPSSPYAVSKASSDHLVKSWNRTYDLPTLITNCTNNFGPYQFPEKLIPCMILSALAGKDLPIYGNGSQIRDWLYVDDHVDALYKVLVNADAGSQYNIGGDNERTNLEIVKIICDVLQNANLKKSNFKSFSDQVKYVEDRPGHDKRYAVNSSKIAKDLSWRAESDFHASIHKTVHWYIDNQSWWQKIIDNNTLKRFGVNPSLGFNKI